MLSSVRLAGWLRERSRRPLVRLSAAYVACALVVTAAIVQFEAIEAPRLGLVRTLYATPNFRGEPLFEDRSGSIDLEFLEDDDRLPRQRFSVLWTGFWFVPQPVEIALSARGDDRVEVFLDRRLVVDANAHEGRRTSLPVTLAAGPHELIVRYQQLRGGSALDVTQVIGDQPADIPPDQLFARKPRRLDYVVASHGRWPDRALLILWVGVPVLALTALGARAEWRVWARPGWRSYVGYLARVALPALLVPTLVFLVGPHTTFTGNRDEFGVAFTDVVWPWLAIALGLGWAVLFALGGLVGLLSGRVRRGYLALLLAAGLLCWIEATLLLPDFGPLYGAGLDLDPFAWRAPYEAALWTAGVVLAIVFARPLARIAPFVSGVFIAAQLAVVVVTARPAAAQEAEGAGWTEPPEEVFHLSRTKNVVHIVLDAFLSEIFGEAVEHDRGRIDRGFPGFIFFADHLGAFPTTRASMPAMLTGLTYRNETTFDRFFRATVRTRSISTVLDEHGFTTHSISFHPADHPRTWSARKHDIVRYRIPTPYGSYEDYVRFAALQLMDLSIFRHVPQGLKPWVYNDDQWLVQSGMPGQGLKSERAREARPSNHVAFLDALAERLTASEDAPVYTFIHVAVPHPPMVVDEQCAFIGNAPITRATYTAQSRCAMRVVRRLLDRLRALDVYDRSVVLVTSDHGWPVSRPDHPLRGHDTPAGSLDRIGLSAEPLLAVKPAGAQGPVRVSYAPTAITDVPATILDLLGLPNPFPGVAALRLDAGGPRRRVFAYHTWQNADWSDPYFDALYLFTVNGRVRDPDSWSLDRVIRDPSRGPPHDTAK